MVSVPPWWLTRPPVPTDQKTLDAFDDLLNRAVTAEPGTRIDYRLAAPKWQFLSHLADRGDVVLHGTGAPDIRVFEPRQSNDVHAFGNQAAVYAASDGIWPIFFAIVDRERYRGSLVNGCARIVGTDQRRYFFSLNRSSLDAGPWRHGSVYLLPAAGFRCDTVTQHEGFDVEPAQLANPSPVIPIARLEVGPNDFPFLVDVRGHDETTLRDRAERDPDGFPWLDPG